MSPSSQPACGTVLAVVVDGELVLRLAGEIDLTLRPHLGELTRQVRKQGGRVVLEAQGVTFCDGTLAGFLVETFDQGPAVVRAPSRLVRDVLAVYGLNPTYV